MRKSKERQLGSVYLLMTMILPVLSILAVFGLDLGGYYYRQQYLQQHADQAALIASSILPDSNQAREAVSKYLNIYDLSSKLNDLRINQRSVSLRLVEETKLVFSPIFQKDYIKNSVFSEAMIQPEIIDLVVGAAESESIESSLIVPELFRDYWATYQSFSDTPSRLAAKCFDAEMRLLKLISLEILNYYQTALDVQAIVTNRSNTGALDNSQDYCLAVASYESFSHLYQFPKSFSDRRDRIDLITGLLKSESILALTDTEKIWGLRKLPNSDPTLLLSNLQNSIKTRKYQNQHRPNYKIIFVGNKIPSPDDSPVLIGQFSEIFKNIKTLIPNLYSLKIYYLLIDLAPSAINRFELWEEAFLDQNLEEDFLRTKLITSESEAKLVLTELFQRSS